MVVAVDYILRVLTPVTPPVAILSRAIARALSLTPNPANAGPKIFAWRVGFLFAMTAGALAFAAPTASVIVAAVFALFTFLDGVLNFCVGCWMYTLIVLPWLGGDRAST